MAITGSEKEKMIYQAVCDIETNILSVIESCQPIGLEMREYMTCTTLALAYVIESMANHMKTLSNDTIDFDILLFRINCAHEKAVRLRNENNESK